MTTEKNPNDNRKKTQKYSHFCIMVANRPTITSGPVSIVIPRSLYVCAFFLFMAWVLYSFTYRKFSKITTPPPSPLVEISRTRPWKIIFYVFLNRSRWDKYDCTNPRSMITSRKKSWRSPDHSHFSSSIYEYLWSSIYPITQRQWLCPNWWTIIHDGYTLKQLLCPILLCLTSNRGENALNRIECRSTNDQSSTCKC